MPWEGFGVVNLGTGVERSLLELLDTLETLLARSVERLAKPARLGDVRRSVAGNARLNQLLGPLTWTPFEDALRATIEDMAPGLGGVRP